MALSLSTTLTSCSDDDEKKEETEMKTLTVDATAYNQWVYVNLKDGKTQTVTMEGSDDESAAFSMFSKKVKTTPSKAKETKEIVLQREKHVVKEAEERLTFSDLGLNQWVVKCCQSMGIVKPTPVQVVPPASFHP